MRCFSCLNRIRARIRIEINADPQQCSEVKKKGKDGNTFGYQIPNEKAELHCCKYRIRHLNKFINILIHSTYPTTCHNGWRENLKEKLHANQNSKPFNTQFGSGSMPLKHVCGYGIRIRILKCWMSSLEGWRLFLWLGRLLWRPRD